MGISDFNKKILQILRNTEMVADRAAAIAKIEGMKEAKRDGELIACRYTKGDTVKAIIGVVTKVGGKDAIVTYFEGINNGETIPDVIKASLDDLTTEVNSIEQGAGLEDNGSYKADAADNILKTSTSLKDADSKLSDAIEKLQSNVEIKKYANKVSQELQDANYTSAQADVYNVLHTNEDGTDEKVDDFQLTYTPLSPMDLKVPATMGDITQGTKASELKGKPLSEILDSIIFKTIYPTVTDPSASISFKGFNNNGLVEVGATAPKVADNFTTSLYKGKVEVKDGVTATTDYVGNASATTVKMTYVPYAANANAGTTSDGSAKNDVTEFDEKFGLGKYTYRVTIDYVQGSVMRTSKGATPNPMPTTNKGNVANPHAAGNVTSGIVTLNATLPIFATTNTTTDTSKQGLIAWGAMTFAPSAKWPATTASAPLVIETPRKINTFYAYNEVSGKFDVNVKSSLSSPVEINKTFGDKQYKYFQYKWVGGAADSKRYQVVTF